jgi:signal transduction histidine kinase
VIRRILEDLRPPALDDQSLADAVRLRAHSLQRPGEFDISVTIGTLPDPLPPTTEVAAYRIASEALANAARHSGARLAEIEVGVRDGSLELCVRDNGVGLAADHRLGVGLLSMRDRAEALGGSLVVAPNPHGGTSVAARLPLIAANGSRP